MQIFNLAADKTTSARREALQDSFTEIILCSRLECAQYSVLRIALVQLDGLKGEHHCILDHVQHVKHRRLKLNLLPAAELMLHAQLVIGNKFNIASLGN